MVVLHLQFNDFFNYNTVTCLLCPLRLLSLLHLACPLHLLHLLCLLYLLCQAARAYLNELPG